MAEAPRTPLPSGYDDSFVDAVEDEDACSICYLTLKEPVLTRCGHRFCKECLEEYFRRREGEPLCCPLDKQTLNREDIFPDKATERKILSKIIKCQNDGCEWTGDLRYKECHFTKMQSLFVPERDHLETCKRFPVRCDCEEVISREMVSDHIEDHCPLTKLPCPYKWLGCSAEVQRAQLESHIECATKIHFDLACGELWDTQEKLKEKITHFKQLEEKVNDIQRQHQYDVDYLRQQQHRRHDTLQAQLKQEVNTCEAKQGQKRSMERKRLLVLLLLSLVFLAFYLTRLEDKVQKKLEETINIVQSLEAKFETKPKEKESDIQSLHEKNVGMVEKSLEAKFETKLKEIESVIQSLHERVMILEVNTDVSNIYTWKVTSFEEKLTQAKIYKDWCFKSVPFYAFGYKLMIELCPNGNGVGLNTHLSIFVVVMKGEYDAILPWGFSKRVKFTLIDQQDNLNLRQNVFKEFIADPNEKAFKKPVDGETRLSYGVIDFVSHDYLRKRRFLVDDTLFIKVQVISLWF